MSHFEILLPFGLPAPEIAPDLLRELRAPALSMLLARSKPPIYREFDPFSRMLPHEAWLHDGAANASTSPPLAVSRMQELGLTADDGIWFIVQPVHIHVARDHLVLTDKRRCPLSDAEARVLFDTAQPLFQQADKMLRYGDASTWFARADDWHALQTATPDAACGHNIDIWMPHGEGERDWRKLQNEVQMEWHEHPVNEARAAQRLPPVNSLWLWGMADARQSHPARILTDPNKDATNLLASPAAPRLIKLDDLSEVALAEEWGSWLERMHQLEQQWFAPLLEALKAGKLTQITLRMGHNTQLREFCVTKSGLLKFWSKPSLARLAP